jgi:hypothetical protein
MILAAYRATETGRPHTGSAPYAPITPGSVEPTRQTERTVGTRADGAGTSGVKRNPFALDVRAVALEAAVAAGGHSLVPMLDFRMARV